MLEGYHGLQHVSCIAMKRTRLRGEDSGVCACVCEREGKREGGEEEKIE